MTKPRKNASDRVANQMAMAMEISRHFDIQCTNKTIQSWQRNWTPPFPKSNRDGTYSRKACFKWIEKNYLPKVKEASDQPDLFIQKQQADIRAALRKDRREEIEIGQLEGTIIEREAANRKIIDIIVEYHAVVKRNIQSLCDVELAKKIIGAIESDCARIANEPL